MAKKPLGVDKMGIQKTMRTTDYLADCGGQFALNAMTGLVSAVLYFYTEKVGVAAATAANVLLAAKIVDAFTDLIMGKIMDNGKSPKGKCRPWFLRMAIPAFVAIVALFTVPAGLTGFAQVAYLFLSNVFLTAIVSTAIMIPYSAILVMRTKSLEERNKMGIFRAAAGYVIGMVIAIALVPLTNALGPNGVADQAAYIKFAVAIGALSMIFLLILYKTSKETAAQEEKPDDGLAFGDAINKLFHNKYWVIVLLFNLITSVSTAIASASGAYYCKWIFGNDNLVAIAGSVGLLSTILGFALSSPIIKKLGIKGTINLGLLGYAATYVVRCVLPTNLVAYIGSGLVGSFLQIPLMCLYGVLLAMAVDYNEYKYDKKLVAVSSGAIGFGSKVGNGLGALILAGFLVLGSYDATLTEATGSMRTAIYAFSNYLPIVLNVGMFLIFRGFDLEEKLPAMRAEVAKRHTQKTEE